MLINFKKVIKEIIRPFYLKNQLNEQKNVQHSRSTMYGCLQQATQNGLNPKTIIDVGAANGTPALYESFPNAHHILIEPLKEFASHLNQLTSKLPKAEYIIAAATDTQGEITINVHPDLFGSSIYKEGEDSDVNGLERIVQTLTLDQICQDRMTQGPYLIKVDTQGSEVDVIKGAEKILKDTDLIILEVSLFEFFKGGPQIHECLSFMKDLGFVAYDIFGLQYRMLDGAMSQVDIAFVKDESQFRKFHFYATREQRSIQNAAFQKNL